MVAAAVDDGVLLLTFAEELRITQGLAPIPAVLQAARIRLRPRVMTTLPMVTGLIPLALNWGCSDKPQISLVFQDHAKHKILHRKDIQ